MEEIKLDKIDEKLLSYIFHNFRTPITQIAKKCRISREQAEYRIKKYEEKNLVKGYLAFFNLYAFGYNKNYIIRLRVKKPEKERLSQISSQKNILVLTKMQCYGEWDYILTVFTKEKISILDFISSLYDLWKEDLLDYEIFEPIELHFFPLKIFGIKKEDKTLSLIEAKKVKIDNLDNKIIEILSNNAKIKIIDLAEKVNQRIETINYRLKRLEKEIIIGYRIFLNLDKAGYKLAQIILKLNNISKKSKDRLLNYASQNESIHAYSLGIGNFNVVFQIIYKSPNELIEEINKIKNNFSDSLLEYELIHIENELEPKTI